MKKGFTLIELLVVVLIIGILSSVALPQYTVAVQKTRAMSLLPVMKAIDTAEKVYYLETGEYTNEWDNLSVEMPGGYTVTTEGRLQYDNYECWMHQGDAGYSVYCYHRASNAPALEKYFDQDHFWCWAPNSDTKRQKVCKSISGKSTKDYSDNDQDGYKF